MNDLYDIKIKICGITNENDLRLVETGGADYIGFINVRRSPRYINLSKIKKFKMENEDKAVLVLEPKNPLEVLKKVEESGIPNIQLHSLQPFQIEDLKSWIPEDFTIIRAVGIPGQLSQEKKMEIISFARVSDAILFDYELDGKTGGTGIQIPFRVVSHAANIALNANNKIKLFLAGGLDLRILKKNFAEIRSHFDVVDFNSSIEKYPGVKDPKKVVKLLNYVKAR